MKFFANDKPLKFDRSKSKELLAYLVNRNGAAVNTNTLCAVLWEDEPDTESQRSYLRHLVSDLIKTLASVGANNVIIKNHNAIAVNVTEIDCDYYRFLQKDPAVINTYTGEYMVQYSWAELTFIE